MCRRPRANRTPAACPPPGHRLPAGVTLTSAVAPPAASQVGIPKLSATLLTSATSKLATLAVEGAHVTAKQRTHLGGLGLQARIAAIRLTDESTPWPQLATVLVGVPSGAAVMAPRASASCPDCPVYLAPPVLVGVPSDAAISPSALRFALAHLHC